METNNEKKEFSYTYSAKEQAELKRIREKYMQPTPAEDKMTRLRRLDASVTKIAQTAALSLGVVGTLVLGLGMSLCMTEFSAVLGAYQSYAMWIGIAVGLSGAICASLAYPLYRVIVKHRTKRIAPEVLKLTDELMR